MGDQPNPYYGAFELPSKTISLASSGGSSNTNNNNANNNNGINRGGRSRPPKRQLLLLDSDRTSSSSSAHHQRPASEKKKARRAVVFSNRSSNKGNTKKPFGAAPPPPDDVTNEDSSLLDLFTSRQVGSSRSPSSSPLSSSSPSSSIPPSFIGATTAPASSYLNVITSSATAITTTTQKTQISSISNNNNNTVQFQPPHSSSSSQCYLDLVETPPQESKQVKRKRQSLTPAPIPPSPSWRQKQRKSEEHKDDISFGGVRTKGRVNLAGRFEDEADSIREPEEEWSPQPCLDWSLKTKLSLSSSQPFGFNATNLKSSEESSGTAAFTRCIDIDPLGSSTRSIIGGCGGAGEELSLSSALTKVQPPSGSQLDTSLGAQFHQCCLYWQHPSLPVVSLFPRDIPASNTNFLGAVTGAGSSSGPTVVMGGVRLEQKALDIMFTEWVDSFRSIFQLLRTRLCPYFYVCSNQFTCLFSAAGTQGLDFLQVLITPSPKKLRDALKEEGIEFSTVSSNDSEDNNSSNSSEGNESMKKPNCSSLQNGGCKAEDDDDEPDENPDKWLDEMGISQDVSVSHANKYKISNADGKNKYSLVEIGGNSVLAFFNFLINSKHLLVANNGPFVGLPPTILSPIAFRGAVLKQLKVRQSQIGKRGVGELRYCIDINGPILPHVVHMLCPVLQKTVGDFQINVASLDSTLNLNGRFRSSVPPSQTAIANAFELQNLSDCGLNKSLIEILCRPDNIGTVKAQIECKNGRFKWS